MLPWDFAVILAALVTLIPWRGSVRVKRLMAASQLASADRLSLYASTIAFQWALTALISWRSFARHMTAQELGLTLGHVIPTLLATAGLTLLLCASQWAALQALAQTRSQQQKQTFLLRFKQRLMPRTPPEKVSFIALACTAGLSEEFIYRGFVLAVFLRMFDSAALPAPLFAVPLSSAWFAVAHLYQGKRGMVTTLVVAVVFSVVRIWTGSLLPAVFAHAGVDLLLGLFVPQPLGASSYQADD